MSYKKKAHSDEIIEDVVTMMKKQVGESLQTTLEKFIRKYYGNTAAEDLVDSEAANLYGAALAHWNFAHSRKAGNSKVRIYNPQFEEHGWQSTHTVVEIINDDMPFLIDSVRMTLNARSLTTHLVIHPVINIRRDSSGKVVDILELGDPAEGSQYEAVIHVEVDRQTEKDVLDAIANEVRSVLNEVSLAVEDWQPMCNELHRIVNELKASPPPIDSKELSQSLDFL